MTDTGQVPGEGQPESAGMVEQPGVPAHGAYTYLSEAPAEDEDLLLPGAQGAWGNEVPPPAPEPVVEAVHEPGPHETAGRDTGSVDLGGVRLPHPGPASVPPSPILSAPHDPAAAPQPPRRPLHLGPPIPDTSASPVRSLADRGPAGAPARQPGPPAAGPEYLDAQPQPAPQNATPWGAAPETRIPAQGGAQVQVPAEGQVEAPVQAQPGVQPEAEVQVPVEGQTQLPAEGQAPAPAETQAPVQAQAPVEAQVPAQAPVEGQAVVQAQAPVGAQAPAAETVVPAEAAEPAAPAAPAPAEPADAAQATMARLATQAAAQGTSGDTGHFPVVHGHDGVQPAHGHDGVYTAPAEAPAAETETLAEGVAAAVDTAEPDVPAQAAPQQTVADPAAQEEAVQLAQAAEAAATDAEAAPAAETAAVTPEAAATDATGGASETEAGETTAAEQTVTDPGAPASVVTEAAVAEPAVADPAVTEAVQPGTDAEPGEAAQSTEAAHPTEDPQSTQAEQPAEAMQPDVAAQVADASQAPAAPQVADLAQPQPAVDAPEPVAPAAPVAGQDVTQDVTQDPAQATGQVPAEVPATVQEVAPAVIQDPAQATGQVPAEVPATVQEVAPAVIQDPAQATGQAPAEVPAVAQEMAQAPDPAAVEAPAEGVAPVADPAAPTAESAAAGADPAAPVAEPAAPVVESATPVVESATPQAPAEPTPTAAPAQPGSGSPDAVPAAQPAVAEAPEAPQPQAPAPAPDAAVPDAAVPDPGQPLGQFVPVQGQVPTTPHLAPTPPQPVAPPAAEPQVPQVPQEQPQPQPQPEPVATVPAPREGEPAQVPAGADAQPAPDAVQHTEQPEDLDTRAADQEESTAAVAEARQSTGPAAPAYADAEREAVLKVMRERRDIRNGFRSDPIPHEVLLRVLEAAHTAPSVGHSQPWDFVVIRSAETRQTMHELAMRQREAYAKSLPKGRAKQFKELKIEAILDTPVNIVVTADPTRGGRHTLGRHTQPQMAPYSSALAVENLWLAARAEGLGVGWVSFFDEREMVRALGLPEHLEVVAYLCVGYVDEFPDEPELMQAGWSKRRPLSWVVHEETYGRRALPGEEPHDLLAETVAQIRPLDAKALGEAWERQKRMTKPAGALGMLEIISAQLCGLSRQCPPPIPEPAAVAIFAGDHGVHAQGVTPWPQEVTAQMVANFLGGGAVCNAFAAQVGAEVCVVDVGVAADLPATPGLLPRKIRGGTSDMTAGPAMTREEAEAAIEVGIETARDLVAAGNKALLTGEMGIANTTASAALISVFTGADPAEVTGRGTGINDETLVRKTEVVRRALELHQPDPADPIGVLAAVGGFEHAAMVGLLLGGASLRTPVILDGVSAGAAALVARAIAPEVLAACIAGHRSAEPGHVAALNKLGLRPLVDLDLRLGEGTGALLALPLVQSTARAMHEVATFDAAGVTEK
ncbi:MULTISPECIES: nicotinate-nucleotide--dimethylbenzimidazole phosphoribosyltransferase [Streptomyces]|uniref:Nicotinate-nucleotide--dimethylbenzimidazole phosphoribosyltransferase n=2 Tax=Streptomyces eurythermus TaxID=42237 RepID=A0ABW6Z342_9ACTN|nr:MULTISPECIES: nicotinate-nucleotide--dimethylbenzimidazole phosphoribosyltransferase [Streptomyces]QIS70098.1 nicotinate-nucleotide--dimethylbenzimidazole phosphoribosyltransferase [Streptomyces sp. DSM 40868]